jgi:hypothetical protein
VTRSERIKPIKTSNGYGDDDYDWEFGRGIWDAAL